MCRAVLTKGILIGYRSSALFYFKKLYYMKIYEEEELSICF